MKRFTSELSQDQIDRLDEIDNAAYRFASVLAEVPIEGEQKEGEKYFPWDASILYEILDSAIAVLGEHGYKVRYPFLTADMYGNSFTCDYLDEE